MTRLPDDHPPRRGGVFGAIVLAVGLAILGAVMAADIGGTPTLEKWAFMLGLALAPMLQAVGIAATLVGGYLVWRARRGD